MFSRNQEETCRRAGWRWVMDLADAPEFHMDIHRATPEQDGGGRPLLWSAVWGLVWFAVAAALFTIFDDAASGGGSFHLLGFGPPVTAVRLERYERDPPIPPALGTIDFAWHRDRARCRIVLSNWSLSPVSFRLRSIWRDDDGVAHLGEVLEVEGGVTDFYIPAWEKLEESVVGECPRDVEAVVTQ